jgi:hypothetical protein
MMRLTRRNFVKVGAVAAAVSGPQARLLASGKTELFVYDSKLKESARVASIATVPLLDIAAQQKCNMRALRTALPKGEIAGLTRWSDYVLVRGYAEEQGKRIKAERQRGALIEWRMG